MKNKSVHLIQVIVLSTLFFVTVFSLMGGEQDAASLWTQVHIWAGGLMLAGSAVHLRSKFGWMRGVFQRQGQVRSLETRRNLRTDLGMLITGSLCTLAGVAWLVYPALWLNRMHTMSGMLMMVFVLLHLALHRRWLVNTSRGVLGIKAPEKHTPQPEI